METTNENSKSLEFDKRLEQLNSELDAAIRAELIRHGRTIKKEELSMEHWPHNGFYEDVEGLTVNGCFIYDYNQTEPSIEDSLSEGNVTPQDLISILNDLENLPVFIDSEFGKDAQVILVYDLLKYSLEHINSGRDKYWELSIISTESSEADGSPEGIIKTYMYNEEADAEHDIVLYNQITQGYLERE